MENRDSPGSHESEPTSSVAPSETPKGAPLADTNPARARFVIMIAIGLTVIFALVVVFFLLPDASTNDAQVDAHIPIISPRIAGYVSRVAVNDNQLVDAGQTLVELDSRDYQAAVQQARAAYTAAVAEADEGRVNIRLTRDVTNRLAEGSLAQRQGTEAELMKAQSTFLQTSTSLLDEAKANLVAKESTNTRAQLDLKRYQILVASQDVSEQQFDSVAAAAHVAQADVTTAEKQVLAAQQSADIAKDQRSNAESQLRRADASLNESVAMKQQVSIRRAAYQSSVAAMDRAKATLDEALLQLSYTRVVSPTNGQVTQRAVEVGQYIVPGQQLLTIVPIEDVFITANFKETQLAHVQRGQRATIHADEYRGTTFWGTVDSIAGSTGSKQALLPPQNATGNFVKVVQRIPVKILVDRSTEGGPVLRPGMNVEVSINVH